MGLQGKGVHPSETANMDALYVHHHVRQPTAQDVYGYGSASTQVLVVLNELMYPEDEQVRWDALKTYNILDTVRAQGLWTHTSER